MATHAGSRQPPHRPAQPYLDIAIASGFSYLRGLDWAANERKKLVPWLPLLVEFRPDRLQLKHGETPLQAFTRLEWLDDESRKRVEVPELFRNLPAGIRRADLVTFCVLLIRHSVIEALTRNSGWIDVIAQAELGPPIFLPDIALTSGSGAAGSKPAASCPQASARTPPTRAVIGVIDDGIAFAHPRFFLGASSRIEWCWLQNVIGAGSTSLPGKEYSAADIKQKLAAANGDADAMYQAERVLDFSADGFKALGRRRSHGTHVLDLAANDNLVAGDATLPIIAVDMPEEAIGDPAGSTLTVHAAWGLIYLLARAEQLRQDNETLPVVANISYGPHEGPHDGSALLERIMDLLIEWTEDSCTPLQIVLAAGNSRQSRTHAGFQLCEGGDQDLTWRLQPGGLTPSFMEIWLPESPGAEVEVTLTSPPHPVNRFELKVSPSDPAKEIVIDGKSLMIARYVVGPKRSSVVLCIAPTAANPDPTIQHAVAASGIWVVKVANTSKPGHTLDVHAWIKRGDTPAGRRAMGRQSYFDDPAYRRLDDLGRPRPFDPTTGVKSYVTRRNTLSGIATGKRTIVVGGFRRSDGTATEYSSAGGQSDPLRQHENPNWLCAADDSPAHRGVLAAGNRAESWCTMNGTSVAAPLTARAYAMAWIGQPAPPVLPLPGLKPPTRVPAPDRPLVAGRGLLLTPPRRGRP